MQVRPPAHKRTHLKHPESGRQGSERLWLRRYWIALASVALISAALITFNVFFPDDEEEKDVYVSVKTRLLAGDNNNVFCTLSLLVDPEQEKGLQQRQALLTSVVNSVLSEVYTGSQRPPPAEVRTQILTALNKKLPRKLQVRDVFLQELVIGNS